MKKHILFCVIAVLLCTQLACGLLPSSSSTREDEPSNPVQQEAPLLEEVTESIPQPTATEFSAIPFEATPSTPNPENLIQNGYFLEDFDYWKRELVDEGGGSKTNIVPFESSDFRRALHLEHTGLGNVQFYQTIPVSTLDLVFSATFQAFSTEGPIMGFSGTGYALLGILYLDANQDMIGMTRIINFNENLFAGSAFVGAPEKMQDTNTMHNIQIESGEVYKHYQVDINTEINNNLLGIDPTQVKYIQIAFLVGSNDKDASADLYVSELELLEK
jgi:hypothetical protein